MIRVNPATGMQSVISSGGNLQDPPNLVVAPNGDIFVADTGGVVGAGLIIRINPQSGSQTVVSSGGNFTVVIGIALESGKDERAPPARSDRDSVLVYAGDGVVIRQKQRQPGYVANSAV